jgi:hypothetical protein
MKSKELLQQWKTQKEMDRFLFVPFITEYAAKLANSNSRTMVSNPSLFSRSLIDCQKLFGYDGFIISYDDLLLAETIGCQVDFQSKQITVKISYAIGKEKEEDIINSPLLKNLCTVMDQLLRLSREHIVSFSIAGIETMKNKMIDCTSVDNDTEIYQMLQKIMMNILKPVLEKRPDLLIIHAGLDETEILSKVYQPIFNFVKYYQTPYLLLTKKSNKLTATNTSGSYQILPGSLLEEEKDFDEQTEIWEKEILNRKSTLLVTDGEIPVSMITDQLHNLMDLILD